MEKLTRGTNPANNISHAETRTLHAREELQTVNPQANRLNADN